MSGKKSDVFSELVVGVFMVAVLALLVYFTVVISGVDVLKGDGKVSATVVFTQVGGLKGHDNVMYRGTKVGTVDRVEVTPTNLAVRIEVDRGVVLRTGYRISVCNLSMLGGNYLLLEEGEGEPLDLAGTVFRGETPTDWMRDVSEIASNLKELTSKVELDGIITNFEAASLSARNIAGRLDRGEGMLGSLLAAESGLYDDIRRTVTNVSEIVARVERGEGTVGRLLSSDDAVYADLKRTLANVSEVSDRLRGEKFLADLEGGVAAFRAACESLDAKATVESANRLLASLNELAEGAKGGQGTLGRLLSDGSLYDEVQGVIRDVRQVLDNYRDTTPISTFSSLIGGAL